MKRFLKIFTVLLLSACCISGAAACEKTSEAPPSEHMQESTFEYAEENDECPERPERPVERRRTDEQQRKPRKQKHGKRDYKPKNGENRARKRIPVTPAPKPLPAPFPTL